MSLAQSLPAQSDDLVALGRDRVAENVRALMGRRKINQSALAKVLDLSQPSVSRRVSGLQAFTTDELIQLARIFDVDLPVLLEGVRSRCFPALTLVENPDQLELPLDAPDRPVLRVVES